ncbi:hypothetical protein ILYODFUR_030499 [Ilyodon furcidens]|uniref:Uncharacterized protein n=1 Tax=Ilyodon furcidens TaxID=33524 RepID=A0ABV0U098_9TELE
MQAEHEPEPGPSGVSLHSDCSKGRLIDFKPDQPARKRVDQQNSEVPSGPSAQQHQTQLDSIFMELEQNMVTFLKDELKKFQKFLSPECSENQWEDEEELKGEDKEQRRSSREALLNITVNFLRKMKQEELAKRLHNSYRSPASIVSIDRRN